MRPAPATSIASGAQPHHAVAALRQRGIMRHQHQRGAALLVAGEQQLDDLAAGRLVEIAGRLVGDEDRRMRRQRARERDALLLAAGQLGRIVIDPLAQADRRRAPARRARRRPRRPRARAAPRRFPAPSWWGSGGTTGTRCRHGGRGSARARPRRARAGPVRRRGPCRCPGRSSPAATISRVDLPEPDGPTRPTASPAPICRPMSLRIWTRAAPRPSERFTPDSEIAGGRGATEVSFMQFSALGPVSEAPRSYGKPGGRGPDAAFCPPGAAAP